MKTPKISEAVVRRLPIYLRYLHELNRQNVQTVSSSDLGHKLDLNPAQIRKDLAYFGEFGKKGIGYDVNYLIEKIRQILKLDQLIQVAVGDQINNLTVQHMSEMVPTIRSLKIRIGIITVPALEAQFVANEFVKAGIEAILNFAPAILKVPNDIRIHNADFTTELQSLAFYLE
jgi:redox-sensing transcriptional repressor